MTNNNNAGIIHIAIVLLVLLVIGIAGFYYASKQGFVPSIPISQTQEVTVDTSQWIPVSFSECGADFKYPPNWEGNVSRIIQDKYECNFSYWENAPEGELQSNFITIGVEPDKLLGEVNVVIDRDSLNTQVSQSNGIETIVETKEDKAVDGTVLTIKSIYLKKGTYYFRILAQYKNEDSEVAQFADDIALTVAFTEDDTYYQGYAAEVENYLGDWLNENK